MDISRLVTRRLGHGVIAVRVRGAWAGVDIDPALASGRRVCEALQAEGVLAKDTHGSNIRFAPHWSAPTLTSGKVLRDAGA